MNDIVQKEVAVELKDGNWLYLKYPANYTKDQIAEMVIEYILKNDGNTNDVIQIII